MGEATLEATVIPNVRDDAGWLELGGRVGARNSESCGYVFTVQHTGFGDSWDVDLRGRQT